MIIYNDDDIKQVKNNIEKIVEKIDERRRMLYPRTKDIVVASDASDADTVTSNPNIPKEPSKEDIDKIVKFTLKFISDKKRKVYGGYAQNKAVSIKNKDDVWYGEDDIPDIDVYSPTPIEDLVELCDALFNAGYTDVIGKEAMHKETYKIFVLKYNAIDLSYVPKQIYDNIPYIEHDNIRYVHPSFAMIDLYRMMTEPLFSSWRWPKTFSRLVLLQKHYPIYDAHTYKLHDNNNSNKSNNKKAMDMILEYVMNNDDAYIVGDYAYNEYVKSVESKFEQVKVNSYQIVMSNYKKQVVNLIQKLEKNNENITYTEFYPFWSFTDYNVEIYCNGNMIAKIYSNCKRCMPIKTIMVNDNKIHIGAFDVVLMMEMILSFRERVLRNKHNKSHHDTLISNLVLLRRHFFDTNKKLNILSESMFQSFIPDCIGETCDPIAEAKHNKKARKERKGSAMFIYKPIKTFENKWIFDNTSGNEINNPRNRKLSIK